jgi:hypothetical protein
LTDREAVRSLFGRRQAFAPSLIDGLKDFQELLAELGDTERSQRMEHLGALQSGYYVLPMAAFVAKESIALHCEELAQPHKLQDGQALRDVLMSYVRDAYPLDTVLPIGSACRRLPFLVVTSPESLPLGSSMIPAHGMNVLLGKIGIWQLLSYSQEGRAVFFLLKVQCRAKTTYDKTAYQGETGPQRQAHL